MGDSTVLLLFLEIVSFAKSRLSKLNSTLEQYIQENMPVRECDVLVFSGMASATVHLADSG